MPHTEFIGTSTFATAVRRLILALASDAVTVCIVGPTGSGKSVVARALHHPTRAGQFVRVPAPQLDDALVANELLGHAPEAYTGAVRDRVGVLMDAAGGTLFVDDADDLGTRAQGLLLDVAEGVEVRPLGRGRAFRPAVRLLFGFREDPRQLATAGSLRRDLLHRIDQERIVLLPLAAHACDIPVLAVHLLRREAARLGLPSPKLAKAALAHLAALPWPGNVRELDACIQRAYRRARWEAEGSPVAVIEPRHFTVDGSAHPSSRRGRPVRTSAEELRLALADADGHHGDAARALGMAPRTFWRKLKEVGLQSDRAGSG